VPCGADDEQALAKQYGRYGYRRVTALLHAAGWSVNDKRVERIRRCEGLKALQRQPKRGRLWLNDGSCIRLRPEYPGHIWAYDFVEARTHDGRKLRILAIIDEASRECLALMVARPLDHEDILAALAEMFLDRGTACTYQIGQRQRAYRYRNPEMAGAGRREDALHHARLAMGERLQREFQRLAA
jgi:putative transposase